jgi:predicted Zn-dependent peptidase
MIVQIALAVAVQGLNPVVEVIDPSAQYVSVQAVIRLPELSGREQAEAELIAETVSDQIEGFATAEMRDMSARAGESLQITLMPDHIRIQFGCLPSDYRSAITYVDQIIRSSVLPQESLTKAMEDIPYRSRAPWNIALRLTKLEFERIRQDEVLALYHRLFRPENVWLSVGGPLKPGTAEEVWEQINADWKPGKPARASLDRRPLAEVKSVQGREAIIELRGKEIPGSDPAMATHILAAIALGSGKGSAMFERLREAKGWSYRQEAILWPSAHGFVPRLIMASGDKTSPGELAAAMKEQLIEAVNHWDDADLARAKGMAEGILLRGIEMSPLYFNHSRPVTDSLDDQTFLAGYWLMKTGHPWDSRKILGGMALTGLKDLKEAALDILDSSQPRVIPANG